MSLVENLQIWYNRQKPPPKELTIFVSKEFYDKIHKSKSMKFRKKPVIIEAFKLGEKDNPTPAPEWFGSVDKSRIRKDGIIIPTLEGSMLARWGDWIIKGVNGEIYPCKPDIFEKTYDAIKD